MKRILAPALLSLMAWGGCGSNQPPMTNGNCTGLITVNLLGAVDVSGTAMGSSAVTFISATDVHPNGVRLVETTAPPLALPNIVLKPGMSYQPGPHKVRASAANGDPTTSTAMMQATILAVVRTTTTLQKQCPSVQLTLMPPTLVDNCQDLCDAGVRCGTVDSADLGRCQATCAANANMYSDMTSKWTTSWTSYFTALIAKNTACDPNAMTSTCAAGLSCDANKKVCTGDPGMLATAQVQQYIGQLDACSYAMCGNTISDCGTAVTKAATTPPMVM